MKVRPAAVAGRFYSADPAELAATVDGLLTAARPAPRRFGQAVRGPLTLVVPHAGYQYSGAVAAAAYVHLIPLRGVVTRAVVLGPAHFTRLEGMAVPGMDAFATPLGPVLVDDHARDAAAVLPEVHVADAPHAGEHSVETQLPFLLRVLGAGVRVLPVLVGEAAPSAVSRLLAGLLSEPGAVAVVSTDLSHYLPDLAARERDRRTAAAVLARDVRALERSDACGYDALRGLLHLAASRNLTVELLRLATSADVGADPGSVVGYGAFLVHVVGPRPAARPVWPS